MPEEQSLSSSMTNVGHYRRRSLIMLDDEASSFCINYRHSNRLKINGECRKCKSEYGGHLEQYIPFNNHSTDISFFFRIFAPIER